MLNKLVPVILVIVGLVNAAPIIVFFDADLTRNLYGIEVEGGSLTILMRHRGALLGLVGFALFFAVFKKEARIPAIAAALFSKLTFIFLVLNLPFTAEIRRVASIDAGTMFLLVVALVIHLYQNRKSRALE